MMIIVRRSFILLYISLPLSLGVEHLDAREPRVVFNDDAQMLMETPRDGATKFVKAWLDREIDAVPFSTFVFLAATPDICTFDSGQGESYGDRFGADFSLTVLANPRIETNRRRRPSPPVAGEWVYQ